MAKFYYLPTNCKILAGANDAEWIWSYAIFFAIISGASNYENSQSHTLLNSSNPSECWMLEKLPTTSSFLTC